MKRVGIFLPMIIPGDHLNGGVPKVFINTLGGLRDHGLEVFGIVHQESTAVRKELDRRNIPYISVSFEVPTLNRDFQGLTFIELLFKALRVLSSIPKIRKAIRQENADCILAHDAIAALYLAFFPVDVRALYLHSTRPFTGSVSRLFLRISSFRITHYLCPTEYIKNSIDNLNVRRFPRSLVIDTPVEIDHNLLEMGADGSCKGARGQVSLVYIGRISPIKNLISMVELLSHLIRSHFQNVSLHIYGEANNDAQIDYLEKVKQKISSNDLEDVVVFKGFSSDPASDFRKYDASIILSEGEALPMAGIESLIAGTPVIAYDRPGLNDLICQSSEGVLFQPGEYEIVSQWLREGPHSPDTAKLKNRFSISRWTKNALEFLK
ncbi:glycosyltransferase [Maritalea mediterranea]|uniref:Glycosyltransferase n=1 Tax=Maritalea mediterranea TaxID=2909667 RepID=A0ABS9E6K0_9HYPH|nr:glycosyltransferase [Maritalea mediterranea]